jgi:hypothetical protein
MKIAFWGVLILVSTAFYSCKKVAGEGGSSTIKGVVVEKKLNSVGNVIASYPIADEDVYIIYGEEGNFYDDRIRTSFDGSFEFRYLQPGKYRVFAYSECPSCPSGVKEELKTVEITGKKSTIDMDTIYILNY